MNFDLFSAELPGTPGPDIGFEICTDRGLFRVAFPVSQIDAKAWHDLVGRYNGRTLELICDERVMVRRDARGALVQNAEPVLIGAETDQGRVVRPMTGELEQAALWTRALTLDELAALVGRATRGKTQ